MTAFETHDPAMGREILGQRPCDAFLQMLQLPSTLQHGGQAAFADDVECGLRSPATGIAAPARRAAIIRPGASIRSSASLAPSATSATSATSASFASFPVHPGCIRRPESGIARSVRA